MGTRGRKSAASLAVVTVMPGQRPEPPEELTTEQAQEWRAIVARMPADWFLQESWPMLANLCRHIVTARKLGHVIDHTSVPSDIETLREYDKLLGMRDRETKAIVNLSRQLRLSHQQRYQPKTAGSKTRATEATKPWEAKSA